MKKKQVRLPKSLQSCAVIVAMLSTVIFGTGCISAQSQSDSLYNPFLLENADYPYSPLSCVIPRNAFDRLRSSEAIEVIQKAFADSGIELEEKVWLGKENAGVYLNGYSAENKIGFVLINRWNMDESFIKGSNSANYKKRGGSRLLLKEEIKSHEKSRERHFQTFMQNKDGFLKSRLDANNERRAEIFQKYVEELEFLKVDESSRDEFYVAYLKHRISLLSLNIYQKKGLVKDMLMYIDTRFDTSPEKLILLQHALEFEIPKALNVSLEFVTADFEKLKEIKSDKKFIENFLIFKSFIGFNHGTPSMTGSKEYQAFKAEIIHNYPLNKWFENTQNLDTYYDKRFLSLEEAKRIDKRNKSGKQFIAPISTRYDMMMYSQVTSFEYPEEEYEELGDLRKEYREKNALLPEVRAQRKKEYEELNKQYPSDRLRVLKQPEKDAFQKERRAKYDALEVKYKALEGLTEEEKAVYQSRIDEIMSHINEWSKNSRAEGKAKTICRLEEEVKIYIQWAKSQQGR